ncbi:predicted protein [Sclerotinia sclerotiorum 1980 UF-70]|uniref:Uncharacterized protein n=1 Tax=Sclerotinia sclerotiorum (strain ATCC 18683 / 1980 / Ss-1) TaxID=665079 RepID=A7E793_SCLS1|nr:predicted protein [Sclerotinia sclerotiorum 1980 UF-70]EDN96245.1 predicted protein [Sclerotinia sclerotiorum 1980 UF-70]
MGGQDGRSGGQEARRSKIGKVTERSMVGRIDMLGESLARGGKARGEGDLRLSTEYGGRSVHGIYIWYGMMMMMGRTWGSGR